MVSFVEDGDPLDGVDAIDWLREHDDYFFGKLANIACGAV